MSDHDQYGGSPNLALGRPKTFIGAFLANDPDLIEIARREFEERLLEEMKQGETESNNGKT